MARWRLAACIADIGVIDGKGSIFALFQLLLVIMIENRSIRSLRESVHSSHPFNSSPGYLSF